MEIFQSQVVTAKLTVPIDASDHVIGNRNSAITMLEYGDFECPYCGEAYGIVKDILKVYGNQMLFSYRHFPLTEIHPHAQQAAEASESAGVAGKFWEMHDALFEHQYALDEPSLVRYTQALGLDADKLVDDLANRIYKPKVDRDFISGIRSGVNGTPTFYVNGVRHDGSYYYKNLIRALKAVGLKT